MKNMESAILKNWHIKILVLTGIVAPVMTATGAYFGIKVKMAEDKQEISERVSKIELESTRSFADKTSLQNLDVRMQKMENDITEIKTILKNKLR